MAISTSKAGRIAIIGATGYGVITMRHTSNVNFPYPAAGELSFTIAAETTFTLDNYNGNLWASHSNTRTVVPDERQFSDDQIKELIKLIHLDTLTSQLRWRDLLGY